MQDMLRYLHLFLPKKFERRHKQKIVMETKNGSFIHESNAFSALPNRSGKTAEITQYQLFPLVDKLVDSVNN